MVVIVKGSNSSKEVVELNAKPRPQPPQSNYGGKAKSSHSSGNHGNGAQWRPALMNDDEGKEYNNLAQKAAGTLVFNPPNVMTSGESEWIDARIGLENTSTLVQGLLGKGEVQFRDVSTETNMTYVVKLEGDSGFEIQAKRPDAQILGIDPAVWLWSVTPLKDGIVFQRRPQSHCLVKRKQTGQLAPSSRCQAGPPRTPLLGTSV